MSRRKIVRAHRKKPTIAHEEPTAGKETLEEAMALETNPAKRLFLILGPGVVTGASDDDPSGIGTYSVTGAQFGYATLWTALFCFPLMAATQIICSRVGQVSGHGVAGVLRRHYPRWLLYPAVGALLVANTLNAGADIGAISAAINLLVPIPIAAMIVPIAVAIVVLQIFGSYRLIANVFKWLALALLAYVAAALFARPGAVDVLRHTFVPTIRLNSDFIAVLVAILGTTISPYLWFWQASQEVEEQISMGRTTIASRRGATEAEKKYSAWDTIIGMLASQVVMYFVILTTAATLFTAGKTDIASAADAAVALRPLAGSAATVLFAVGLIGVGVLAVPVLTGSGAYAVSEAFGWKYGLDKRPARAKQFYAVIALSSGIGMLINFVGINPIDALFWTAVINGVLAPPLLALVMHIANNDKVMGKDRTGFLVSSLGWLTVAVMSVAAVAFFFTV
jgi:NRAMP (natural resistance-associated macrophage protein)-like metal ion transporter